jgi:hypothetical protein
MPEPRQWRSHAGGRFMQRARIIPVAKLLWYSIAVSIINGTVGYGVRE